MKKRHLLALHTLALLAWAPSSQAYIDPATGSILLQGLIAAIAGGLAFVKLKWTTVRGWFSHDEKPAMEPNDKPDDTTDR